MSRILSLVLVCACAAACGSSASSPLAPAAAPQPTSVTNAGGTDAGEAARGPVLSADETRFSGRVEASPADAAENTLVVGGKTVVVSDATTIKNGSQSVSPASLTVDTLVDVVGVQGETTFAARLIEVLRDPQVQADGTVSDLSGTASAFAFMLNGRRVTGTSATEFKGGPNPSFARLTDGIAVHVTAADKGTYLQATRVILQEETAGAPEVKVQGTITAITGTAPALTLTVGTTTVVTNAATLVRRKNETLTLSALSADQQVEVTGTAATDGVVAALRVQIETVAATPAPTAPEVKVQGAISAISGTSPALTLTVGAHTVITSSATVVRRKNDTLTLAALAVGQTVEVTGTANSDGAIAALRVQIEEAAAPPVTSTAFDATGTIAARAGTCPAVTFTLNGKTVTTSATTNYVQLDCADLANGAKVRVKGSADGDAVTATWIKKEK